VLLKIVYLLTCRVFGLAVLVFRGGGTRPGRRGPGARRRDAPARGGSEYNIGPAADLLPHGGEVIGFCSWREGLVLRPDLAGYVCGVGDVARRGLRLVNREPGAEARSVLDRELAGLGMDAGGPGPVAGRVGNGLTRRRRPGQVASRRRQGAVPC
jgi:hypothetical protein